MNRHLGELLDLVDCSEQRPLTAAEADQLRSSIAAYEQARRQFGAVLAKLGAALAQPRERKGCLRRSPVAPPER